MARSHMAAVDQISAAMRTFFARGEPFRVFHGSTNSARPPHRGKNVDFSVLNHILDVDVFTRTAAVEPNVSMDKLVQATLARGLVPPVVMEFPGITVGGAFTGSAGESNSFKFGFFDQTVKSVELVLVTGEVVRTSPYGTSSSPSVSPLPDLRSLSVAPQISSLAPERLPMPQIRK